METQSFDDSNISLLLNEDDDQTVISDAKLAEELQLQEAIMASFISLQTSHNSKEKTSPKEAGESSQCLCEICADRKDSDEMFPLQNCGHRFCTECVTRHISTTIKKRKTIHHEKGNPTFLACPGLNCKGIVAIDRQILSEDIVRMWDDAICESMIPDSQKFYCPYKNCSALLVNDEDREEIREAECPFCRRLMCVKCGVPWHSAFSCEEYLKVNENERGREDLMVHELAKEKKWQRCPQCKFFVEKDQGCLHITCRCGFQFCYGCGATWSSNHGGCR